MDSYTERYTERYTEDRRHLSLPARYRDIQRLEQQIELLVQRIEYLESGLAPQTEGGNVD